MYAWILPTDLKTRANEALNQYARMEYGNADATWIVAGASRRSDRSRRKATLARRIRRALSARASAKGFPLRAEDCPARA